MGPQLLLGSADNTLDYLFLHLKVNTGRPARLREKAVAVNFLSQLWDYDLTDEEIPPHNPYNSILPICSGGHRPGS
jgi:hypothetical protein